MISDGGNPNGICSAFTPCHTSIALFFYQTCITNISAVCVSISYIYELYIPLPRPSRAITELNLTTFYKAPTLQMVATYYKYLLVFLFAFGADPIYPFIGSPGSPYCKPGSGVPGGVYICPRAYFKPHIYNSGTTPCKWLPPDESKCHSWGEDVSARPQSIGPDPGGYCQFYTDAECKVVATIIKEEPKFKYVDRYITFDDRELTADSAWGCPGLTSMYPSYWYKSFRCGAFSNAPNRPAS